MADPNLDEQALLWLEGARRIRLEEERQKEASVASAPPPDPRPRAPTSDVVEPVGSDMLSEDWAKINKLGGWDKAPRETKNRFTRDAASYAAKAGMQWLVKPLGGLPYLGATVAEKMVNQLGRAAGEPRLAERISPIGTPESWDRKLEELIRGKEIPDKVHSKRELSRISRTEPLKASRMGARQQAVPRAFGEGLWMMGKGMAEIPAAYARTGGDPGKIAKTTGDLVGGMISGGRRAAIEALVDPGSFGVERPLEAMSVIPTAASVGTRLGRLSVGMRPIGAEAKAVARAAQKAASPFDFRLSEVDWRRATPAMQLIDSDVGLPSHLRRVDTPDLLVNPAKWFGMKSAGNAADFIMGGAKGVRESRLARGAYWHGGDQGRAAAVAAGARGLETVKGKPPPRAGGTAFEQRQRAVDTRVAAWQKNIVEPIQKLDEKQRLWLGHQLAQTASKEAGYTALKSLKTGEDVSEGVVNLIDKRYRLIDDLETMKTHPETIKAAVQGNVNPAALIDSFMSDPKALDNFRKKILGRSDDLAQNIEAASKYGDISFTYNGKNMNGIQFIWNTVSDPKSFDPKKIEAVVVNPGILSSESHVKDLIGTLVDTRRALAQISQDARTIEIAPGVNLLEAKAIGVHAGSYLPDVQVGRKGSVEFFHDVVPGTIPKSKVVKPGRREIKDPYHPEQSLGAFERAQYKHIQNYQQRVAEGLMEYKDLDKILERAIPAAIRIEEQFKMMDALVNPGKYDMIVPRGAGKYDAVAGPGYTGVYSLGEKLGDSKGRPNQRGRAALGVAARTARAQGQNKRPADFMIVPATKMADSELPKYGNLAGKVVEKTIWRKIRGYTEFQDAWYKRATRFTASWKVGKLMLNVGPWLHATTGNAINQIFDGGTPTAIGSVIRRRMLGNKKKTDPVYAAALEDGTIRPGRGKMVGDVFEETVEQRLKTTNELESLAASTSYATGAEKLAQWVDRGLDGYEYLMAKNPISRRLNDAWSVLENGSRLAVYERALKRWATIRGSTFNKALKSREARSYAKGRADLFHFDYENMPLLLSHADKLGFLPFSRYSFGMSKLMITLNETNPMLMTGLREARRGEFERADAKGKRMRSRQPSWTKNMAIPVGDNKVFNFRYLVPFVTPDQIVSYTGTGSYGKEQFGEDYNPFWKTVLQAGGPWKTAAETATGENLSYGRPLKSPFFNAFLRGIPIVSDVTGPRTFHALEGMGPGALYHGLEKIAPALVGKGTARGRKQTAKEAALHAAGIRLYRYRSGDENKRILDGFKAANKAAHKEYEEALKGSKGMRRKFVRKWAKYQLRLKLARHRERLAELKGPRL